MLWTIPDLVLQQVQRRRRAESSSETEMNLLGPLLESLDLFGSLDPVRTGAGEMITCSSTGILILLVVLSSTSSQH